MKPHADDQADDLDRRSRVRPSKPVDQQADADHLAVAEGVREAEERHRRHAPGDEIVAGRNVEAERPAGRQHHHQHEDREQEQAGEIAGEEIEAVENLRGSSPHRPSVPAL